MALSTELGSSANITHRSPHRGIAFLVEALVVLAFLMLSIPVFVQLFASAQLEALHANELSQAVLLATNRAEEFSSNPTGVPASTDEEEFVVACDVTPIAKESGTLFEATITVSKGEEEVYRLETSRYVSGASATGDTGVAEGDEASAAIRRMTSGDTGVAEGDEASDTAGRSATGNASPASDGTAATSKATASEGGDVA